MIAVIDYGAGNIFSVENALRYLGQEHILTDDPDTIRQADAIILPGVGAFPSAMQMLHAHGLTELLQQQAKEKPFLGICLGMQMLFEKSYEFEPCEGLGLLPGTVERIPDHAGDSSYGLEQAGSKAGLPHAEGSAGGCICVFCAFLSGYVPGFGDCRVL